MKRGIERNTDPQLKAAKVKGNAIQAEPAKWKIRAALFVIALVSYADSFGLGLAQDSLAIITRDSRIRQVTAENLKLIIQKDYWWPTPGDRIYRPITTASLLFNYAVLGNGESAAGYHWINFLLHAVNIWLMYELALRLLRRAGPAFFAAAIWAVHPIGAESVTNIVGRADLLGAMSVLGGLLLYLRYTDRPAARPGATALALFAIATAGVFSKESAAVLVGLMLLCDLTFGVGELRAGLIRRLPAYGAVTASLGLLFAMRQYAFSTVPWPQIVYLDNMMRAVDFWRARLTAIKVIGLDLWLLVCPLQLSSDRSYNQIPISGWADPFAWISLLVIIAILAFAAANYRRNPLIFWLAGFAGIALLPTSNLVILIATMMGERFLYLPSVAFALAVVMLAYRFLQPRATTVLLCTLIVLYAGRTFARNLAWKDNLTLASTDVRNSPQSARLHDMLAKSLFEQNDRQNIDRVIQEQERAWAILSPLPAALSSDLPPANLGIYYGTKGGLVDKAQSRPWVEKSIAVLLRAKEIAQTSEKAFDEMQRAHGKPLSLRPSFQFLYFELAYDYINLGRYAEALDAALYGRNLEPRSADAYDLMVMAHTATGKPELAGIALLEKAQVDGFKSATLSAIRDIYAKFPDGACAVNEARGASQLNLNCPRIQNDLCLASADLAQAFVAARQADQAQDMKNTAVERYGCALPH